MSLARAQQDLQATLGYSFNNPELLQRALTHSSYGDGRKKTRDNERLEFLGDRVLGLLTAESLLRTDDSAKEGTLARRLNALVRKETCAEMARAISLGDALVMSRAEDGQGGREKDSILGDAMEALIGAIYLDGGLEAIKAVYVSLWGERLEGAAGKTLKDPKTELQEWAASEKLGMPQYKVLGRKGPDHRPVFSVSVSVQTLGEIEGEGPSKKDAERAAAKAFLEVHVHG